MRVLVTGGANGIGRGIVDKFLRQGAKVCYADLEQRGSGALLGFGAGPDRGPGGEPPVSSEPHFIKCDVSDAVNVESAVTNAIETMGGLDTLINNVGIHVEAGKPCHEVSVEAYDRVMSVNLRSYFLFSKFCLRDAFVSQASGSIVNIGSVHGFQNAPGLPAYAAAKGGVLSLTRQLAVEYAHLSIRVNCVVPGTVNTPMNKVRVGVGCMNKVRDSGMYE
jgi:NAD(P)-dependent dehydrogenase (short-subunit alcohol dehydrogenase family)